MHRLESRWKGACSKEKIEVSGHTDNNREQKLVVGDHSKEYGGGAGMVQEAPCRGIDVNHLNLAAVPHGHEKLTIGRAHSYCETGADRHKRNSEPRARRGAERYEKTHRDLEIEAEKENRFTMQLKYAYFVSTCATKCGQYQQKDCHYWHQ